MALISSKRPYVDFNFLLLGNLNLSAFIFQIHWLVHNFICEAIPIDFNRTINMEKVCTWMFVGSKHYEKQNRRINVITTRIIQQFCADVLLCINKINA